MLRGPHYKSLRHSRKSFISSFLSFDIPQGVVKNHPWSHLLNFLTILKSDEMFSQVLASFCFDFCNAFPFLSWSFLMCFSLVLICSIHLFHFHSLLYLWVLPLYFGTPSPSPSIPIYANNRFDRLLGLAIVHGTSSFVKLKRRCKLFFFSESFNSWGRLDIQSCFLTNTNASFEFGSCL